MNSFSPFAPNDIRRIFKNQSSEAVSNHKFFHLKEPHRAVAFLIASNTLSKKPCIPAVFPLTYGSNLIGRDPDNCKYHCDNSLKGYVEELQYEISVKANRAFLTREPSSNGSIYLSKQLSEYKKSHFFKLARADVGKSTVKPRFEKRELSEGDFLCNIYSNMMFAWI